MPTKLQLIRIKQLLKDGESQTEIARRVRTTRYEVRKVLDEIKNDGLEKQKEKAFTSKLEEHREEILKWLVEKNMSAFLIHQSLLDKKVSCSYSSVKRFVGKLKKQEVYVPVITKPGEEAQVDYGYLGTFKKDEKEIKVWVFNMVLSYSRYAFYTIATDQNILSFLQCQQQAFEAFGGVPASIKIDNLGAGVIEADFYEPYFQERYLDFLSHYGSTAVTARICRGQDKGKVESGIKYVKGNFLKKLQHREYDRLLADLRKWTKNECNLRIHGTTRKIPAEEFIKTEKAQLLALPDERYTIIEREKRKADQYGHIYYRYNFYSVPYHYAGETMNVESNGKTITILKNTKIVAVHIISKKKGEFITLEDHKPLYKQVKTDQFYIEELGKIGTAAIRIMELMKAEKPFHWKNMVKGIIALMKIYPTDAIEKSCKKAIACFRHNYKFVKEACEKKLYEDEKNESAFPTGVGGYYHDLSIYDQLVK